MSMQYCNNIWDRRMRRCGPCKCAGLPLMLATLVLSASPSNALLPGVELAVTRLRLNGSPQQSSSRPLRSRCPLAVASSEKSQAIIELQSDDVPPVAATKCWRPTLDDVERISWGKPAKRKGTGSRGVPHRLNDAERKLFDLARRKGFVEIEGSGWRRERSDAPLVNTYRNWCDAKGEPAVYVHKARDGMDDVVVDLSPLRTPATFEAAARYCLRVAAKSGGNTGDGDGDSVAGSGQGQIEGLEHFLTPEELSGAAAKEEGREKETDFGKGEGEEVEAGVEQGVAGEAKEQVKAETTADTENRASSSFSVTFDLSSLTSDYEERPLHTLPKFIVSWQTPRAEAKVLAKALALALTSVSKETKGRSKAKGAPKVKPGNSRRHGGYGIG